MEVLIEGVLSLESLDGVATALRPNTLVAVDEAQFFDSSSFDYTTVCRKRPVACLWSLGSTVTFEDNLSGMSLTSRKTL